MYPARSIISEKMGNLKPMSNVPKKPSWLPVVISVVAITISIIIFAINNLRFSPAIYIAYLLTPFTPILALAVSRSKDTKARSNIFYDLAKGKKIVSITVALSLVGFVVALPVMYHIAKELSQI